MSVKTAGIQSAQYIENLDAPSLQAFAQAIAFSGQGVPPTWLTRLRKGEFELFERMQIPLSSVLHAEQKYVWEQRLRLPAQVSYQTTVVQQTSKSTTRGKLTFLILETEVRLGPTRCATGRTTVAVKEATHE